jgi:hypothetical protein
MGERWFRQEYPCEFVQAEDGLFDPEMLERAISYDFAPLKFDQRPGPRRDMRLSAAFSRRGRVAADSTHVHQDATNKVKSMAARSSFVDLDVGQVQDAAKAGVGGYSLGKFTPLVLYAAFIQAIRDSGDKGASAQVIRRAISRTAILRYLNKGGKYGTSKLNTYPANRRTL